LKNLCQAKQEKYMNKKKVFKNEFTEDMK
jgi:hypothetical protein